MADAAAVEGHLKLVRQAFLLEYLTLAWMVIEAGVAIGSGVAARSVMLLAFGIDSLIELASAIVLIWRLKVELWHGRSFAEWVEERASRIGGALLFALALYIVAAAGWSLWRGQGQDFSWPGLLVSLIAIPLMWLLSRRKLRLADALGSRALRADAVEGIACGWLSFVVVIGFLAQSGARRMVDRFRDLARNCVALGQGRPRGLERGGSDRGSPKKEHYLRKQA
jgi:divalent metal cation (Fe/Co/Zn/Cd) transporter